MGLEFPHIKGFDTLGDAKTHYLLRFTGFGSDFNGLLGILRPSADQSIGSFYTPSRYDWVL